MADISKVTSMAVDCADGLTFDLAGTAERDLTDDTEKFAGTLLVTAAATPTALDLGPIAAANVGWLIIYNSGPDPVTLLSEAVTLTGEIAMGESVSLPPVVGASYNINKALDTGDNKIQYIVLGAATAPV
jgi:hypothetical protein